MLAGPLLAIPDGLILTESLDVPPCQVGHYSWTPTISQINSGVGTSETSILTRPQPAPALPSDDRYDQGGYAEVVVTCTSRDVPSDHLLEQLRNEGWKVHDFRAQAQRRSDGKTF